MKSYKLISQITLIVLMVLGIAAIAAFFLSPEVGVSTESGAFTTRQYTNPFLFCVYGFLGLACLSTLAFVIMGLVNLFKTDVKKAIASICVILGFVAVAAVCWFLGSPEKVDILGYDGTDNVGMWAQLSDAVIYMCYILALGTVVTMLWGVIRTKFLK